jgi:hypothetical protein
MAGWKGEWLKEVGTLTSIVSHMEYLGSLSDCSRVGFVVVASSWVFVGPFPLSFTQFVELLTAYYKHNII